MQIILKIFQLSLSACFQICLGSNLHGSASNITITKKIYKNNCALTDQSVICHRTLSNVDSCKNNGVVAEAYTTQPNSKASSRVLYVYLACMAG